MHSAPSLSARCLKGAVLTLDMIPEYCGGPNRLNAYSYTASSNATSSSSPSTTGPTASSTPTGPVTVKNGTNFAYLGCYTDNVAGRALTGLQNPINAAQNSVENCATACNQYQYFGVEYSGECYCGNTILGSNSLAPGSTPADTQCVSHFQTSLLPTSRDTGSGVWLTDCFV